LRIFVPLRKRSCLTVTCLSNGFPDDLATLAIFCYLAKKVSKIYTFKVIYCLEENKSELPISRKNLSSKYGVQPLLIFFLFAVDKTHVY